MRRAKTPPNVLFTANVPFSYTDEQLGQLFDPFGIVLSSRVIRDATTGQSRGFGFVDLATDKAKTKAIEALNGKVIEGRKIEVRIAENKEKEKKPRAAGARPAARRLMLAAAAETSGYAAPQAPRRTVVVERRKLTSRPISRLITG